jgi:hypothetical protein
MSSTDIAPQFEGWVSQTSNLDRCTRCGRPRSVHGPDWRCPYARPHRAASAVLIAGTLLAVAGIVLRLASAAGDHQVPADLFLAGVILAVTGLSMLGPQNQRARK